jgi:hypothetical protein
MYGEIDSSVTQKNTNPAFSAEFGMGLVRKTTLDPVIHWAEIALK